MIELVVLDIYGTLIFDEKWQEPLRRPKVVEFLDLNLNIPTTFYTDADRNEFGAEIQKALQEMGVLPRLEELFYYYDSMDRHSCKDLSRVAREHGVNVSGIVLIGDGDRDIHSAERYGTKLVVIPSLKNHRRQPIYPLDELGKLESLFDEGNPAVKVYWDLSQRRFITHKWRNYEMSAD
jgi:hypothetical protein